MTIIVICITVIVFAAVLAMVVKGKKKDDVTLSVSLENAAPSAVGIAGSEVVKPAQSSVAVAPEVEDEIAEVKEIPVVKPMPLEEPVDLSKRTRPDTGGLPYVLVAEDNMSNYKLLEVMLRNIAVTENAINGRKAVERAKTIDYDMILMDIKMPVMNGLDATNAIRQFDTKIPIIAVTANVLDFDKNLALANGCNEFVTKPVIRKRLVEVIETYKRN